MVSDKRRKAERRGRWAEHLAALILILKGYHLLDRRARTPAGELDLVAQKGDALIIVEVKARQAVEAARQSITPYQRRRIERAAALYRARRPTLRPLAIRYDQILFAPWHWPVHQRGAWIPESREARDWL